MIKRVIHLADIHLRTYRLHDEYKEVFENLFSDLKELLKEYEREEIRIVIAGDFVHQKIIISNEQLLLGVWFISKLEEIAPVVLIAGNHDLLENNKERLDSITPMVQFLPDKNIKYFKESKCYLDDNVVWCVYAISEENQKPDISLARLEYGNDKIYVGLFHGALNGSQTDLGYAVDHGVAMDIFEDCDMVMLGDIHKRQSFNHKGITIAYPGSLIQQNFGENITKHGFLLWDIENKSFTEHDVENSYPYYQFKIGSIKDIENQSEIIMNLN